MKKEELILLIKNELRTNLELNYPKKKITSMQLFVLEAHIVDLLLGENVEVECHYEYREQVKLGSLINNKLGEERFNSFISLDLQKKSIKLTTDII